MGRRRRNHSEHADPLRLSMRHALLRHELCPHTTTEARYYQHAFARGVTSNIKHVFICCPKQYPSPRVPTPPWAVRYEFRP